VNRRISGRSGFSLIEVMIGIIFLAIGLLAVAGMQATSVRGNFFSSNVMLATYAAQDRLELLKSLPLTSPDLTLGSHDDGTAPFVSGDSHFRRSYTVTPGPNGNGLLINYVINWKVKDVDHSLPFYTIRAQ